MFQQSSIPTEALGMKSEVIDQTSYSSMRNERFLQGTQQLKWLAASNFCSWILVTQNIVQYLVEWCPYTYKLRYGYFSHQWTEGG